MVQGENADVVFGVRVLCRMLCKEGLGGGVKNWRTAKLFFEVPRF